MAKTSTGGRIKAAVFLLVSILAAAMASLVIFTVVRNLQRQLAEAVQPPELSRVIVASHTLWPGITLQEEDLQEKDFPPDFIPDEVIRLQEDAINRVPLERILAQEFIRKERLARSDAGRGLNAIVPQGMRAISLDISGGSAVAGFLNPGNYVDILVTIGNPSEGTPLTTRTLLQAVTVLAVDNRLGRQREPTKEGEKPKKQKPVSSRPSITVALTPDQVESIAHAYAQGQITMTLRNDIDVTSVETNGATKNRLIGTSGDGGNRVGIEELRELVPEDGTMIVINDPSKNKTTRTE